MGNPLKYKMDNTIILNVSIWLYGTIHQNERVKVYIGYGLVIADNRIDKCFDNLTKWKSELPVQLRHCHTSIKDILILFSWIALKDIFATLIKWRLGYDLPISVNDRVISAFCKDFIFTKLCVSRKLNPRQKFWIYNIWAMQFTRFCYISQMFASSDAGGGGGDGGSDHKKYRIS